MRWSPQQDIALSRVQSWLLGQAAPFFYLAGYAGTGKTTLAKHLAAGVEGDVLFAAYTGKAAHVMRRAGCKDAATLHSLLYTPVDKSAARLVKLQDELKALQQELATQQEDDAERGFRIDQSMTLLEEEITRERKNLHRPNFSLNLDSPLRFAKLLVVDECSMVDELMAEDILSFNVPVLVLGDPAQLPPVSGAGFFLNKEPDMMLTEVHRQALNSPVIALATRVREGEEFGYGDYASDEHSTSSVVRAIAPEEVFAHSQMLVGMNATRRASNRKFRQLQGRTSPWPEKGEKVVCLRNNHELGILNGATYTVAEDSTVAGGFVNLRITPEGAPADAPSMLVPAHRSILLGETEPLDPWLRREAEEFDYGYALTVHKAQGSGWESVLLVDEWYRRDTRRYWLYTGLTRAADRVTVLRRAL